MKTRADCKWQRCSQDEEGSLSKNWRHFGGFHLWCKLQKRKETEQFCSCCQVLVCGATGWKHPSESCKHGLCLISFVSLCIGRDEVDVYFCETTWAVSKRPSCFHFHPLICFTGSRDYGSRDEPGEARSEVLVIWCWSDVLSDLCIL